jgi:hypothetical protein
MTRVIVDVPMDLHRIELGDIVKFKTTGYEIADLRNPVPPTEAFGYCNGEADGGFVPLWCERENREAATIMVNASNVIEVLKRSAA